MQVLADLINLPCRIAKGCKYCRKDVGASCIVQFGSDRFVALINQIKLHGKFEYELLF